MESEINAIKMNDTYELITHPKTKTHVGNHCGYTIKYNKNVYE